MDTGVQQLLLVLLGVLLGGGTVLAWRISERQLRGENPESQPAAIPASAGDVLAVLRSSAVLIGKDDEVLQASAHAYHLGLVREGQLQTSELLDLVRQVRRDGQIRDTELVIRSTNGSHRYVQGRVAPLRSRLILVLAEDRTRVLGSWSASIKPR
jgi:two-component system sensor histidine kinase SenX3